MNTKYSVLRSCLFAAVCLFHSGLATAQVWWDSSYGQRATIEVTTGANAPEKGYDGYTVRLSDYDSASLIGQGLMQADCDDLRVVHWNGSTNTELPRHVIDCNSASTDIRFMMVADQSSSSTSSDYFLYYDNASAGAPTALTTTNVYLWYDDASVNRYSDYVYGRFDTWASGGYYNGLSHNAAGYYQYDTGNDRNYGLRRAVDERDVYVEVETFHTRCHINNLIFGPVSRAIVSGSFGSEESSHHYAAIRAHGTGTDCNGAGYATDGDITRAQWTTTAVDGTNPASITMNQWRRMALATWRVNPTYASFYDEDDTNNWAALGYPSASNLHVTGTDSADNEGRGQAGFAGAQDVGRVRNMLIRRYVEPEPVLSLAPAELAASKTIDVFDPSSAGLYAVPGNDVIYTITVENTGGGSTDEDSIVVIDRIPDEVSFYNGDIDDAGPETNPVAFSTSSGSGLTFNYASDVGYSNATSHPGTMAGCTYSPISGYDANVRFVCVNPKGYLLSTAPNSEFSISFRARIE